MGTNLGLTLCKRIKFGFVASLMVASLTVFGCRDQTQKNEQSTPASTNNSATQKATTTSVLPDKLDTVASPATTQPMTINETDPKEVCRRFLESLQVGNRIAAENLLTRTALQVTGKAGLVLEPLGGPHSRFEFMEPRFATIKNEVAYIDCQITDIVGEDESSYTVSWVVKRQNSGWRISGLLMELDEGRPMKLVSFENIDDVEDIKLRAAEMIVISTDPDQSNRQANLPVTDGSATRK